MACPHAPRRSALRGTTRVIDILIECGGFRPGASGEIVVQRADGTFPGGEKSVRFRLGNTTGMSEKDRANAELLLKHGDVVTAGPKYFVTVDGEVMRPGRVVVESDLTLLGVIAESGGLGKYAWSFRIDGMGCCCIAFGLVDGRVCGGIDNHIRSHLHYGVPQTIKVRQIAAEVCVTAVKCNHLSEWCQATLQFPADLAVLAEKQNFHAGLKPQRPLIAT